MQTLRCGCEGFTTPDTKLTLSLEHLADSAPRPQAQSRPGHMGSAGPYRVLKLGRGGGGCRRGPVLQ